jgi:hypothetical protein
VLPRADRCERHVETPCARLVIFLICTRGSKHLPIRSSSLRIQIAQMLSLGWKRNGRRLKRPVCKEACMMCGSKNFASAAADLYERACLADLLEPVGAVAKGHD